MQISSIRTWTFLVRVLCLLRHRIGLTRCYSLPDFAVCLPGFSVGVIKYVDDKTHKLRYVFKDKETGQVYFAVVFTLLFGKEVESTLAEE